VSFLLAKNGFACRLSEEAREEVDRLPPGVARWFEQFPKSVFTPPAHRKKDSLWLHVKLVESRTEKTRVLLRRLLAIPKQIPTFATVLTREPSASREPRGSGGLRNFCRKSWQYTAWAASRAVHHLGLVPVVLVRGASYGLAGRKLGRQFWTFFAASLCFDFGMTMFFFLYNLFLLDRGYKEDFLGFMTSTLNIGSLAMTIPAGILIHRVGLRKALLFCLLLAPGVFAVRALVATRSALLCSALLAGGAICIWAVAISPAIARLTDEHNRARGFSVVFSAGIGAGVLANLVASRMPGWLAGWRPALSPAQAKQLTLLVACAIVAAGVIPLSRVRFAPLPPGRKNLYPRNAFLWRFLPALALWSLVTGSLSPLSNVYFSQYLKAPLERMGVIFSLSQLCQVLGVLLAPYLFRKVGLVSGIASTQWITALFLLLLASTSAPFSAALIYVAYSGFLWMSEPGLFTLLMDRVSLAEQPGASSLNFFVITLSQAVAVGMTGSGFTRFGYPAVLAVMAAIAAVAASSLWLLLGREFRATRKAETALLLSAEQFHETTSQRSSTTNVNQPG
jgi:MFS family permease